MHPDSIEAQHYQIYLNDEGFNFLDRFVTEQYPSKILLLVDKHTNGYCTPIVLSLLATDIPLEVVEIEAEGTHKHIDTCIQMWYALSELGASHKSLLINIGDRVVTDLGGFVVSTYVRGTPFINVPASLLAMVDASVGGRTGADLGALKNLVEVVNNPKGVLTYPDFLAILPTEELCSGMTKVFRHGLISGEGYWHRMCNLSELTEAHLGSLVCESVIIKNEVVTQDPTEKRLRETLNYEHTLGHTIESYYLQNPNCGRLLHGETIAIGMVLATCLSVKELGFSMEKCDEIKAVLGKCFRKQEFMYEEIIDICQLTCFDKKNVSRNVHFVFLEAIGKPKIDCIAPYEEIYKTFEYYLNQKKDA